MENEKSATALMSAFVRAYHAENAETPIFSDTVARRLMTDAEYERMEKSLIDGIGFFAAGRKDIPESDGERLKWIVNTQLAPTCLARARFCEEALKTAVMTGASQYVILGAGLDTFAWRVPQDMAELEIFQADRRSVLDDKACRLRAAALDLPPTLHSVEIDFSCDSLREKLAEAGFDERKKTFFSWLGVSYYLTQDEIERLLCEISELAAEGSTLVFDYADDGLFTAQEPRVKNMLAMASAAGEPMKFCAGELSLTLMLDKHDFLIYESLMPDDLQLKYFDGRRDGLSAFEHIGLVTSVLKKARYANTKEKILQTALSLFAQNGYEAVSVNDIASELGITKGALYRHYKSKREVLESIVARMESADATRARLYEPTQGELGSAGEGSKELCLERVLSYSAAEFKYRTRNSFAARFRKMLTVEQYGSSEMSSLYRQYISTGPLERTADMLAAVCRDEHDARCLALELYAPIYMLYSLYDVAEDKREVEKMLLEHISRFTAKAYNNEFVRLMPDRR